MSRTPARRHAPIAVAIAAAALALAAPAAVAQTTVTVTGKVAKASGGKVTTLKLSGGQRNGDGTQPPTVSKLELLFPRQLSYDPTGLPTCTAAKLDAEGVDACTKAARIGTGAVKAQAGAILAEPTLTLFNGGRRTILMYVSLQSPIQIGQTITATFSKASGPYGLKLTIPVPSNLQRPLPSLPAAITDIGADVGKLIPRKGRRKARSLITQAACGASGTLAFKAVLTHAAGGTQEATSETACR